MAHILQLKERDDFKILSYDSLPKPHELYVGVRWLIDCAGERRLSGREGVALRLGLRRRLT